MTHLPKLQTTEPAETTSVKNTPGPHFKLPGFAIRESVDIKTNWKVCVVGAGMFSEVHLESWNAIDNANVVALVDPEHSRCDEKGDLWAISREHRFSSLEIALETVEFDVVDIVTPLATHVPLILQAAAASKQVLCQKPFATCPESARLAIETCQAFGVRIMVAEAFRWRAHYMAIKQILDAFTLGEVYFAKIVGKAYCSPHWSRRDEMRQPFFLGMPRLLLQEMGPHWFDLYIHLFGHPTSIKSMMQRVSPHIKGEDLVVVLMQHNAMIGILEASWASRELLHGKYNRSDGLNTMEHVVIEGKDATLILDANGEIRIVRGRDDVERIQYEPGSYIDAHIRMHRHFVECLERNLPFETSAESNLEVLEMIEVAYASGSSCP